jgi:hypothetical protein
MKDRILLPASPEGKDADGGAAAVDQLRTAQHRNPANRKAKVTRMATLRAFRKVRASMGVDAALERNGPADTNLAAIRGNANH